MELYASRWVWYPPLLVVGGDSSQSQHPAFPSVPEFWPSREIKKKTTVPPFCSHAMLHQESHNLDESVS